MKRRDWLAIVAGGVLMGLAGGATLLLLPPTVADPLGRGAVALAGVLAVVLAGGWAWDRRRRGR